MLLQLFSILYINALSLVGPKWCLLFHVFYLESENSVDTFSLTDCLKARKSPAHTLPGAVWAGARFSLTSLSMEPVGFVQSNIGRFLDQYG